jgi:phenylacetate-CoA ligase
MIRPLPACRDDLAQLQSERKRAAVENARHSAFFKGRLDPVDLDRLDEAGEWAKIPLLDKEELRAIPADRFFDTFCIAPRTEISEFWRSGGTTGAPLFYPRTFTDIAVAMEAFRRSYEMMHLGPEDVVHNSFPLGIHPAGHMWARAAGLERIGMNWVGSGTGTPSAIQLQLIAHMRPSVWMGMPSYGLHLANLAEEQGIDLASGPVTKILTSAEPLSAAKREKLERTWGAEVYDSFGMTECSLMGCESDAHEGQVMWTDIAYVEVLDEATLEPVGEGQQGTLVTTTLFTNNATPFLRWNSGDIVTWHWPDVTDDPYSVFPIVRHAHRTAGFFKVRGVNMNHQEFEDLMFAQGAVAEFMCEAVNDGGADALRLSVEFTGGADPDEAAAHIAALVKTTFEVTPQIVRPDRGSLGREYDRMIKTNRFFDRRG